VHERIAAKLLRWCNLILYAASMIVPWPQRSEWLREKRREVWHWVHFLAESGRLNVTTEQELFRHCWGSFADALWCRFNRDKTLAFLRSYPATARFCLLSIFLIILAALVISPASWWRSYEYASNAGSLLSVSLNGNSRWLEPELLWDAAADWSHNPLIAGAATYAWRPSVIAGPAGKQDVLSARVTPEIFKLLGAKPLWGQTFENVDAACADCVVLSHAVWREQFHGDTRLSSEFVYLNGRRVHVVGVLSDRFRLPDADVQVYTPFQAAPFARLPGFEWPGVVLRLADGSPAKVAKLQIQREVRETNFPSPALLDVLSIGDIRYRSLRFWLAMGAFSMLIIVGLNWRTFHQLCTTSPHRTTRDVCRWWGFFALKSGLLVALVWLLSVDLVEGVLQRIGLVPLHIAGGVVMWAFLVGLNVALGWSIRDQNARCRSCLTRLRTQIILSACVVPLWDPSGCDLLCDKAHGMLHIPAMQLSSMDSERWITFDESWQTLAQDQ
jgi:MacB-like periplasmic core domain